MFKQFSGIGRALASCAVSALCFGIIGLMPNWAIGQLTINITFDYLDEPTDQSLKPAFEAAMRRGADRWCSFIDNDFVIELQIQTTTVLGSEAIAGSFPATSSVPYSLYRQRLIEAKAGTPDSALVNALPVSIFDLNVELPSEATLNPNLGVHNVLRHMLGITSSRPTVTFGFHPNRISDFNLMDGSGNELIRFDLDRSDGIDDNSLDAETVIIHEIGHLLGFSSVVGGGTASPLDLFTFTNGNTPNDLQEFRDKPRNLTRGTDRIYADLIIEIPVNNGVESPMDNGRGFTLGHWKNDFGPESPHGVMGPVLDPGQINFISLNDLRAFSVIGWDIPEVVLGDVNMDGQFDFGDIPTFISVLSGNVIDDEVHIRADINRDGEFDFSDVPAFMVLLQQQ